MPTILRIDASSRAANSHSRAIGNEVEKQLMQFLAGARIIRRDLAAHPIKHIANATIEAMFGVAKIRRFGAKDATRTSDAIIHDVRTADAILITTPMYNFGIPSALKAWIDQLVRVRETFAYENGTFRGLLNTKPVYIVIAYGAGGYRHGPLSGADFVRPYLDFIMRFIGLTDVKFITIESTSGPEEAVASALVEARRQVAELFSRPLADVA